MAGRPCLGPDDPLPAPLDFLCGNGKHPAVAQTRFDFYKDASRPAGVWHYVTCAAHREQNHTNSTKKKRLAEEERQRVEEERQLAEEERERVREEERQRVEEEEDEQLEQELLAIKVHVPPSSLLSCVPPQFTFAGRFVRRDSPSLPDCGVLF